MTTQDILQILQPPKLRDVYRDPSAGARRPEPLPGKAKPITIGDSVWIGGNVTILPGVQIGSGSVIGAGSVVTKDIPENVIAVGTPCRALRPITEQDRLADGDYDWGDRLWIVFSSFDP